MIDHEKDNNTYPKHFINDNNNICDELDDAISSYAIKQEDIIRYNASYKGKLKRLWRKRWIKVISLTLAITVLITVQFSILFVLMKHLSA